jgi:alanine-synthesizing transaminase
MFSSRVSGHRDTNRLARAVEAHRRSGRPILDLTVTNPTAVAIEYPPDILAPLAGSAALTYRPEPFGLLSAREAVARDVERRGTGVATSRVDPARIVLTASTSEAYSLLFKLLCEPAGDDILVPVPSYPLFDHLAALDGVRPLPYTLDYHARWELDVQSVDAAWTSRVRALLAVSPNNPTGSLLSASELAHLAHRCRERDAALIIDEVFADYPFATDGEGAEGIADDPALTFRLGGLSKSAGLPQVKLGWILVTGPDALVQDALDRLELIADTYLSVSTPVQVAAPQLIAGGAVVRARILDRIRTNHTALRQAVAGVSSIRLLDADGGWSAVLRVPARESEEDMVIALLERSDTLVHPGFFFDFPHEAYLVLSLLPEPRTFADGIHRLLESVDD